jgi:uncharacterized protein YaiE (UPF0345 family)
MPIKLNGATSGSVELDVPAAVGSDLQVTLPATAGEIVVKDSSGRVGIGTSAPSTSLHVKGSNTTGKGQFIIQSASAGQEARMTFIDGSDDIAEISTDGNNLYFYNETATGAFQWYTNNTERMRIDSSGRLLVGTSSSPSLTDGQYAKIHLVGNTASATGDSVLNLGRGVAASSGIASGTSLGILQFTDSAGAAHATIKGLTDGTTGTNDYPGRLVFSTTADGASSPTERMRIDSSGRVGIGTTEPTATLHVSASEPAIFIQDANGAGAAINATIQFRDSSDTQQAYFGYASPSDNHFSLFNKLSGGDLRFGTTSTERMRIDSSGRLLVGTTSTWDSSVGHQFRTVSGSSWALNVQSANGGSPSHLLIATGRNSAGDNMIRVETNHTALGGSGSTLRFKVAGDGTIFATNTSVQAASDSRLKENIRTSEDGLNIVNQLRPVRFDWKNDQNYGSGVNQLGFIAQEVEQVFPEAVGIAPTTTDFKGEDPKYKTVGPGAFIPVLVKALQEAITKIETLETKVAALEATS